MFRIVSIALLSSIFATPAALSADEQICRPLGRLVALSGLPEASGIGATTTGALQLFAIDDSGEPTLAVLNESGDVVRTVRVTGPDPSARSTHAGSSGAASRGDWEDLTVARCGTATCLYIADIGDNNRARAHIRLYRVPVPSATATVTARADVLELTYPDRAHDAEALFAAPNGDLYLVTKEAERAGIYKVPSFVPGTRAMLTHVATLQTQREAGRVTDADASPDGRWVALRTNTALQFFHLDDLLAGRDKAAVRVDLRELNEPQGEGVTFGADGTVYLLSEGGGKGRPGTFARLRCTLP